MLITALILVVPLMADISGRMSVIRRMRQEQARLERELAEVQAENEALRAELEFVASDAYLERWARIDARMTLPGEVAVIPVIVTPPEQAVSGSASDPARSSTPPSIPEQWHRLFFGEAAVP